MEEKVYICFCFLTVLTNSKSELFTRILFIHSLKLGKKQASIIRGGELADYGNTEKTEPLLPSEEVLR